MDTNPMKEEKTFTNQTKPVVEDQPPTIVSYSKRDQAEEPGLINACISGNSVVC